MSERSIEEILAEMKSNMDKSDRIISEVKAKLEEFKSFNSVVRLKAMSRKELEAHADHLERKQEEYEKTLEVAIAAFDTIISNCGDDTYKMRMIARSAKDQVKKLKK